MYAYEDMMNPGQCEHFREALRSCIEQISQEKNVDREENEFEFVIDSENPAEVERFSRIMLNSFKPSPKRMELIDLGDSDSESDLTEEIPLFGDDSSNYPASEDILGIPESDLLSSRSRSDYPSSSSVSPTSTTSSEFSPTFTSTPDHGTPTKDSPLSSILSGDQCNFFIPSAPNSQLSTISLGTDNFINQTLHEQDGKGFSDLERELQGPLLDDAFSDEFEKPPNEREGSPEPIVLIPRDRLVSGAPSKVQSGSPLKDDEEGHSSCIPNLKCRTPKGAANKKLPRITKPKTKSESIHDQSPPPLSIKNRLRKKPEPRKVATNSKQDTYRSAGGHGGFKKLIKSKKRGQESLEALVKKLCTPCSIVISPADRV